MESDQNLEINKIHIARPIFAWEPGLLNMIFEPHKNMPACKKSAIYLKYWANYMLFIFFLEVSEIQWSARFPISLPTPIPNPYLPYPPHTKPTPYLPHTYPYLPKPTHTYPLPNLLVRIRHCGVHCLLSMSKQISKLAIVAQYLINPWTDWARNWNLSFWQPNSQIAICCNMHGHAHRELACTANISTIHERILLKL